jgi:TatD DNase family protein
MIRSAAGRRIVDHLPKDRVLTETDGPYVKGAAGPALPADVRLVINYLSTHWSISTQDVEDQIATTFKRLVGGKNSGEPPA